ncbi:glycoside hydrolase family 32 protein [Hymenobacter psychrotolerans]|uniref:Fructan beta-fructosidase n=1 Tax=Hymenobacter psychrotolerans DSM 18569 TaxID=1121959 RepID=A0A1M6R6V2_9BACT|nr:glycoside hydrolase family 32 protein [Hymenobacter psychrotolerans]SHK28130.1 fructan beta-fructosidase [Hymenobacter psychrotolerans DSM 18569]
MKYPLLLALAAASLAACNPDAKTTDTATTAPATTANASADSLPPATPQYRPAYHFSPAKMWMNDPNGMVYLNGTYHLFFQHHPDGMEWGPMHWGHATSKDLVTWQEQPIALYPDSLGWIFSGSAVIDKDNTAGFGQNAMVAIFTHHSSPEEKKKTNKHQYQSLAYSLDEGKTWKKYDGNPVLPNPGIQDFRDPKVSWNEVAKKWVMTLATKDRITFYSSANLKDWTKLSEFGEKLGAHGGVWECPDLFPMTLNGKTHWVLLVSINPGGPNGGSATQYFVGQFDGKTFTPATTTQKWVDWGKDNYAGVTWAGTGARKIFLGWMSNWEYANQVPTSPWRNATTVPRDLALKQVGSEIYLTSTPVKEVAKLAQAGQTLSNLAVKSELSLTDKIPNLAQQFQLKMNTRQLQDFALVLGNAKGEELVIGYDKQANHYYIDRSKAGQMAFSDKFAGRHPGPRVATGPAADLTLLFDAASVEVFADGGLTTMTELCFPTQPYTTLKLKSSSGLSVDALTYTPLKPTAK